MRANQLGEIGVVPITIGAHGFYILGYGRFEAADFPPRITKSMKTTQEEFVTQERVK